jgi:hypothetical protein
MKQIRAFKRYNHHVTKILHTAHIYISWLSNDPHEILCVWNKIKESGEILLFKRHA